MSNARFGRLREQALAALGARDAGAARMLQELDVLQTELEMQQDELIHAERHASTLAGHYRQLFSGSPAALVLLDETRRIEECNQLARELLGLGQLSEEQLEFERFVVPEGARAWARLCAGAGETVRASGELVLRQAGGARRTCRLALGRQGTRYLLALEDLTELRAAEALKRWADTRLAQVLRDSSDGVAFVDAASGLITEVNEALAVMLHRPALTLPGTSLESLFDERDQARHTLAYRRAADGSGDSLVALRFARPGREPMDAEVMVGQLAEDSRRFVTLLVRDVTARVQLEAEREELLLARQRTQKMVALGQLAAGIAHDVNNVLTAILACASPDPADDREALLEALDDIRQAALRGREVTGRLGTLSRTRPLHPARFDLCAVLREVHALVARSFSRAITLELELPTRPLPMMGDAGEWHQAFLNLAINARDAMPHGGTLRLSAHPDGRDVVARVEDTGMGMSPAVLARIYEPFFTTKAVGVGTGLGLSHVHSVAQAHGVTPHCTSMEGHGTTFTFRFPQALLEVPSTPNGLAAARYQGRVLVVDDDRAVRRATVRRLAALGITVLEAESAARALEVLPDEAALLSLVLTDLTMPGLDGAHFALEVNRRWPALKVVVVTGNLHAEHQETLKQARIEGVLTKPFSSADLLALVSPHLTPV